jgi:microcin C transport system permease protein
LLAYIIRRLLLIIPTILGIMLVTFAIVQFAPGGPVEREIARLQGTDTSATARISGSSGGDFGGQAQPGGQMASDPVTSRYRGAQGLDPEFIKRLERQFGFDKPAHERFLIMLWNYVRFDFGRSYFRDIDIVDLVMEKMPVSISLGPGSRFRSASPRPAVTAPASTSGPAPSSSSATQFRASCSRSCSSCCSPAARSGTCSPCGG